MFGVPLFTRSPVPLETRLNRPPGGGTPNLVLAHQFLGQLDEQARDAVLGNVGTIISFRLGLTDARMLEKEVYPEFAAVDLVNLPNYNIYLKLMVDGAVTRAFSGETVSYPTSLTLLS